MLFRFAQWTACLCNGRSGCISRSRVPDSPAVLIFKDEGEHFSNRWMIQGVEAFQRNGSASGWSPVLKHGERGRPWWGLLSCALNSLSPNSSFFLRQLLCKFCIVAPPKLHWAAKDKLCCLSLGWNINAEQLSPECVFTGGLCTLDVLWPVHTWGSLCAPVARCGCWGTELVQLLRAMSSLPFLLCSQTWREHGAHRFLCLLQWAYSAGQDLPLFVEGCDFAEDTGIVKHLERAEKLRFVLLGGGTFCE